MWFQGMLLFMEATSQIGDTVWAVRLDLTGLAMDSQVLVSAARVSFYGHDK